MLSAFCSMRFEVTKNKSTESLTPLWGEKKSKGNYLMKEFCEAEILLLML